MEMLALVSDLRPSAFILADEGGTSVATMNYVEGLLRQSWGFRLPLTLSEAVSVT